MVVICMSSDKSLIMTSKETIYQKETAATAIRFLIPPTYDDSGIIYNLADFVVALKFVTPDGRSFCVPLTADEVTYKDKLSYVYECDADFTAMSGNVKAYLTFLKTVEDNNGEKKAIVIHTGYIYIPIESKEELVFIPDKSLQAIDRYILQLNDKLNELEDIAESIDVQKADNIVLDPETNEIYLTSNGEIIGSKITIDELSDVIVDATADEGLVHVIT